VIHGIRIHGLGNTNKNKIKEIFKTKDSDRYYSKRYHLINLCKKRSSEKENNLFAIVTDVVISE